MPPRSSLWTHEASTRSGLYNGWPDHRREHLTLHTSVTYKRLSSPIHLSRSTSHLVSFAPEPMKCPREANSTMAGQTTAENTSRFTLLEHTNSPSRQSLSVSPAQHTSSRPLRPPLSLDTDPERDPFNMFFTMAGQTTARNTSNFISLKRILPSPRNAVHSARIHSMVLHPRLPQSGVMQQITAADNLTTPVVRRLIGDFRMAAELMAAESRCAACSSGTCLMFSLISGCRHGTHIY